MQQRVGLDEENSGPGDDYAHAPVVLETRESLATSGIETPALPSCQTLTWYEPGWTVTGATAAQSEATGSELIH